MRTRIELIASLVVILLLPGCQGRDEGAVVAQTTAPQIPWTATISLQRIDRIEQVRGYWALTDEWSGFMGLALEINDDRYRYWFYSDVRLEDEPEYPIEGRFSIDHGILVLDSNHRLYDTEWLLVTHEGQKGLFPNSAFKTITMRRESPRTRMLFPVGSDVEWPIFNAPASKTDF
jgi:hypothetical protein